MGPGSPPEHMLHPGAHPRPLPLGHTESPECLSFPSAECPWERSLGQAALFLLFLFLPSLLA